MTEDTPAAPAWLRDLRAALGPAPDPEAPPPAPPAGGGGDDEEAWEGDDRPLRERLEAGEAVQLVAFRLGGALHGADVLRVEEVIGRAEVRPLPSPPPRLLGMMRLRGDLLPVVDVAPALGVALDPSRPPAVLVVAGPAGRVAVAADDVSEVLTVPPGAVREAPHASAGLEGAVLGVARVDGALVTLVDLPWILRETATPSPGEGT